MIELSGPLYPCLVFLGLALAVAGGYLVARSLYREPGDSRDRPRPFPDPRACRRCGCTEEDCSGCIRRTGEPCYWVAHDLCSACVESMSPEELLPFIDGPGRH